ncbi:MAG TPA: CoA transferase [Pirellulales bacterium]|nr:CoA transferase [Pirellulales bacterium]
MAQPQNARPLEGITIVDLSRVLAGPYCTMILSQLGARVIKVEMPGTGDDSRAFGPFVNGKSLYFSSLNYDKQSIALNLKHPDDRETLEGLLAVADVVVENFRPGTMEKLGYGWETLHERFPNLIYGAASGFGDSGPYSKRAAYDMVVQGMGGIMSMTGQSGAPPTRVGVSIGDLGAGLYLTIGVLGALVKRQAGGGAVKVDVAMLDCQVAMLEDALAAYLSTGEIARPQGSRHPEIAPFQVYTTSDSYLVIAAGNDHLFELMARAMARPDLLENAKYKTNALRHANVDSLQTDMETTLKQKTTSQWLDILNAAGVPCGPVNDVAAVTRDPQIAARNMIVSIADPTIGKLQVAGNPIKLSGVPEPAKHAAPPEIDADREAILDLICEKV